MFQNGPRAPEVLPHHRFGKIRVARPDGGADLTVLMERARRTGRHGARAVPTDADEVIKLAAQEIHDVLALAAERDPVPDLVIACLSVVRLAGTQGLG